jgi:hypothetical protein
MTRVDLTIAPYFHVQKARPIAIFFFVVGIAGLCATWTFAREWLARSVLTAIFGGFVVFGVPAVLGGGCWRSRLENGHVYWEYPSRFYGKNDCCRIQDVAEFQFKSCGDSTMHYLVLRDGVRLYIAQDCFGYADAFLRALQEENPAIVYTEKIQ